MIRYGYHVNPSMQESIMNDMTTNNENIQRKKLKEQGHTPSYIEWMIWKTKNNVPEGIVDRRRIEERNTI